MGFPRQENWSGLPFPSPGDLPHPGIELTYPAFGRQILYHWATWEAYSYKQEGVKGLTEKVKEAGQAVLIWWQSPGQSWRELETQKSWAVWVPAQFKE